MSGPAITRAASRSQRSGLILPATSKRGGRRAPATDQPKTRSAVFLFGAAKIEQLSRLPYPMVAFVGRSNVGKSSLLNRLVGQRKLARVSKRPGRTQEINFFLIDAGVVFADLPGYGFARVPRAVQDHWRGLVEGFLGGHGDLRLVVVLIDVRRGLQAADRQLLDYLATLRRRALVVATKADKLTRSETMKLEADLAAEHLAERPVICSATSGDGIGDLWRRIEAACSA